MKVHPRVPAVSARTDPADFPTGKEIYATRDVESLQQMAAEHGTAVGALRRGPLGHAAALDQDAPGLPARRAWSKKWGSERVDAGVPPGPRGRGHRRQPGGPHARAGPRGERAEPEASARQRSSSRGASPVTRRSSRTTKAAGDDRPAPTVSPELKVAHAHAQARPALDTLPERLALAKTHGLSHIEFLEQLFSDEVSPTRRATRPAAGPGRPRLDPHMALEAWDDDAKVTYDRAVWSELVSLRFVDQARNAFILGPVGVGKTFMATASGTSPAAGGSASTSNGPTGSYKRLKAARLDASYEAEMRKLIGVDLLIIDDFALTSTRCDRDGGHLRARVERHHSAATVLTSNRDPPRVAGGHGRPVARPVRRRPPEERRVGARHRGRVLPPATRSRPSARTADGASAVEAAAAHLTPAGCRDHRVSRPWWARGGPMLLATGWSLGTGKRHIGRPHSCAPDQSFSA